MKKIITFIILLLTMGFFTSCSILDLKPQSGTTPPEVEEDLPIVEKPEHNDFSKMSNREMESAVNYQINYRPKDGYVGDVMPYYENGKYYIFFLKDQGSSYNHSIYLVETTDFLHYEEKGEILKSSTSSTAQDNWIGTGSVCKVDNTYYFFYTGHNDKNALHERVMVATSENDLYHFKKLDGVYIDPTNQLSKVDFRDPDVCFDEASNSFILTVTTNANSGGTVIVKYTVSKDLKSYTYDKIIYTDTEDFWNLECSDTFKIGNYWYLSYSGQDDTLWVAKSRSQYNGYGSAVYGSAERIEGKYFYAPKAVSNGVDTFFVGWARRRGQFRDDGNGSWAGNIVVSKAVQNNDGSLYLAKLDNLNNYFRYQEKLDKTSVSLNKKENVEFYTQYESFMLEGSFKYTGTSDFGFIFGLGKDEVDYGHIRFNPSKDKMEYCLKNFKNVDAEVKLDLSENKTYNFTLVCEGSVIVLYVDGYAAMTTRYYGKISTKFGFYSSGSSVEFNDLAIKVRA